MNTPVASAISALVVLKDGKPVTTSRLVAYLRSCDFNLSEPPQPPSPKRLPRRQAKGGA